MRNCLKRRKLREAIVCHLPSRAALDAELRSSTAQEHDQA